MLKKWSSKKDILQTSGVKKKNSASKARTHYAMTFLYAIDSLASFKHQPKSIKFLFQTSFYFCNYVAWLRNFVILGSFQNTIFLIFTNILHSGTMNSFSWHQMRWIKTFVSCQKMTFFNALNNILVNCIRKDGQTNIVNFLNQVDSEKPRTLWQLIFI